MCSLGHPPGRRRPRGGLLGALGAPPPLDEGSKNSDTTASDGDGRLVTIATVMMQLIRSATSSPSCASAGWPTSAKAPRTTA